METEKFKVGDWVECCSLMPGIVQEIDIENNNVKTYQPHYAIEDPTYVGGSNCSYTKCGLIKISEEQAKQLLRIGKEKLTEIWNDSENIQEYHKKIKLW